VLVTLIHNPNAGDQDQDGKSLRKLLGDAGHEVRYHSAKEEGWKRALKRPADLIVVAGGDGTVGRVIRRVAGRGIPLALLPSGTANNIARSLEQVERPFEELVGGWERARRVKLDVGVAKGPWGERNFIEGVGFGLFAGLLASTETEKKPKPRGGAGEVESALRRLKKDAERFEAIEVLVRLDGKDLSGHYLMLEALNLRYVGPNMHLAPDSKPGDGEFEVVLVTEDERERIVHYLESWQDNRERLAVLPSHRGRRLQIEWTGFPLHVDDKLYPKQDPQPSEIAGPVEARLEGAAVEFLMPG
jgi:diacylglycerol kinase family enzyme